MEKEAMLYRRVRDNKVHCYLCHHHCKISDSEFGICDMRKNKGGRLYIHAYGEVIAANIDPIEKNHYIIFCQARRRFQLPRWAAPS